MGALPKRTGRHRAVFLDRDGTLNEEVGYIARHDQLRVFPFAACAVRRLNEAGLRTVLVTNQAGIARGFLTERDLRAVHEALCHRLADGGARLDGLYFCPHGGESLGPACACRKPAPGMLEQAARDLDLDLARSFAVGDRYRDLVPAFDTAGRGILVLTGHGRREHGEARAGWPRQPDFVAADLLEASGWILAQLEADP